MSNRVYWLKEIFRVQNRLSWSNKHLTNLSWGIKFKTMISNCFNLLQLFLQGKWKVVSTSCVGKSMINFVWNELTSAEMYSSGAWWVNLIAQAGGWSLRYNRTRLCLNREDRIKSVAFAQLLNFIEDILWRSSLLKKQENMECFSLAT